MIGSLLPIPTDHQVCNPALAAELSGVGSDLRPDVTGMRFRTGDRRFEQIGVEGDPPHPSGSRYPLRLLAMEHSPISSSVALYYSAVMRLLAVGIRKAYVDNDVNSGQSGDAQSPRPTVAAGVGTGFRISRWWRSVSGPPLVVGAQDFHEAPRVADLGEAKLGIERVSVGRKQ